MFYNGLTTTARQMLNATAEGAFIASTYNERFSILEKISNHNGHWADPHAVAPKRTSVVKDTDVYATLTEQLSNMVEMMKNLTNPNGNDRISKQIVNCVTCTYCQEPHHYDNSPGNPEQVNYVHNNNTKTRPFS